MKYCKRPVVVEAFTFEEVLNHAKFNNAPLLNNAPWCIQLAGHLISHETDDCYLIPTLEGVMKFTPGDMLIIGVKGEIYPCKADIFHLIYDLAE